MEKIINLIKKELIGKKINHTNQHSRKISLEVENVEIDHKHRQITPDTRENDWWGESADWDEIKITFVDGSSINVTLGQDLDVVYM